MTSPNQGLPCLASWGVKRRDPGNEVVAGIMAYYGTLRKGRFFCRSEREVEGKGMVLMASNNMQISLAARPFALCIHTMIGLERICSKNMFL